MGDLHQHNRGPVPAGKQGVVSARFEQDALLQRGLSCMDICCWMCPQVSFVNSICTYKGGTHVNYVLDQVTK